MYNMINAIVDTNIIMFLEPDEVRIYLCYCAKNTKI